jgi:hypothetical protein
MGAAHLPLPPGRAGAPEAAALAVSKLEAALSEVRAHGSADYLAQHARLPKQAQQVGAEAEGSPEPERTDAVRDLSRCASRASRGHDLWPCSFG